MLYTIGELARSTGLPVRTIRFYSDAGVLPPTDRGPAGHRRYDRAALVRLGLVRTLRDLGVDLATVQRVLASEISVAEAAAAHADALEVQIRDLRLRRSVLRLLATRADRTERDAHSEGIDLMHRLAMLGDADRRRLMNDFIDDTFGGVDANPELVGLLREAMPELPEEPSPERLEAWVELAELVQEPEFRAGVRRAAEYQAAERAAGDRTGLHGELTAFVASEVTQALADGIDPASASARPVLDRLVAAYAAQFNRQDLPVYRAQLLERLAVASDRNVERYWTLLSTVNGWPAPPPLGPVLDWFARALEVDLATRSET